MIFAQVGVDAGVTRLGTVLHPPGHEALELPSAHQGSPGVTLMGRGRDGDIRGPTARPLAVGNPRGKDVGGGLRPLEISAPGAWGPLSRVSLGLLFTLALHLENCMCVSTLRVSGAIAQGWIKTSRP